MKIFKIIKNHNKVQFGSKSAQITKKPLNVNGNAKNIEKSLKPTEHINFPGKTIKNAENHLEWDHNAKEMVQTQKVSNMRQIMIKFMKKIFIPMFFPKQNLTGRNGPWKFYGTHPPCPHSGWT